MKNRFFKVLLIVLILAVALSCFAACQRGNNDDDVTKPPVNPDTGDSDKDDDKPQDQFDTATGLRFLLRGSEYEVSGIGNTSKDSFSIPTTYNGRPVTSIGNNAFEGCTSLRSIAIPDGIKKIGDYAFKDCSALEKVEISSTVETLGRGAFTGCPLLETVEISAENTHYTVKDGFIYDKNITNLVYFPSGYDLNSYRIPDSVTTISGGAFENPAYLTKIVIGNNVTTIGLKAFSKCTYLDIYCLAGGDGKIPAGWNDKWADYADWQQGVTTWVDSPNITLGFSGIEHTITLDTLGGEQMEPVMQYDGFQVFSPDDPVWHKHRFLGWYSKNGSTSGEWGSKIVFPYEVVSEVTFYAKWIEQFEIKYVTGEGATQIATELKDKGSIINKPVQPVKENYRFDGWYSDSGFTTPYEFGGTLNSDVTVYAKWVKQCTVHFDVGGGVAIPSITRDEGQIITLPENAVRDGFKFMGWFSEPNGLGTRYSGDYAVSEISKTLYAYWKESCMIYFDYNYELSPEKIAIAEIMGETITVPAPEARDGGWRFDGWYDTSTGTGNKVEAGSSYTVSVKTKTFFAKWVKQYTITFDLGSDLTADYAITNDTGTVIPAQPVPSRTGYDFVGWTRNGNAFSFPYTLNGTDKDITVSAAWTPKIYDITFVYGSASSDVQVKPSAYDSAITPPDVDVAGEKRVLGWFRKDGSVSGDWGEQVTFPYTVVDKAETFYAKWINIHSVTFNTDGGSEVGITYFDDGAAITFADLGVTTKKGHKFKYWLLGGAQINYPYTIKGDIVLTAVWEKEIYTVIFDYGVAGIQNESITAEYLTPIARPEITELNSRDGYVLDNWLLDGKPVSFPYALEDNVTLTAGWVAIESATGLAYTENFDGTITITGIGTETKEIFKIDIIDGKTVSAITNKAFAGNTDIRYVQLGAGVKTLGAKAFENCTSLTTLSLPSGLVTFGEGAVLGAVNLADILTYESGGSGNFFNDSGILYSNAFELVCYPAGKTATEYEESAADAVKKYAFANNRYLEKITFTVLNNVEAGAFFDMPALTSIEVNAESAYSVQDGVLYKGNELVYYISSNPATSFTVPENVTYIYSFAFNFADKLQTLNIGAGVAYIGEYGQSKTAEAFICLDNLTAITVDPANASFSSENGVLYDKNKTRLYYFAGGKKVDGGQYTVDAGITSITAMAFAYNKNITSIYIPSGVLSIGTDCFLGCAGTLESIYMENPLGNQSSWNPDGIEVVQA